MSRITTALVVIGLVMSAAVADAAQPDQVQVSGINATGDEWHPAAATNGADNEFFVVWEDGRTRAQRGFEIYGQRLGAGGERIGHNVRISGSAATADDRQPAVAYNQIDNEFLVVWADLRRHDDRGWEIYAQRVDATGKRIGNNFRLSGGNATGDEWMPAVAHNATNNEYMVLWLDNRHSKKPHASVIGQRVDADGKKLGANVLIARGAASHGPGDRPFIVLGGPDVVHNRALNEYLVVWTDQDGIDRFDREIVGQRLRRDGVRRQRSFPITGPNATSGVAWPAAVLNPIAEEYFVIWTDDREDWQVYGQRLTYEGDRLRHNRRLSDRRDSFHTITPEISFNTSSGTYLAAWEDERFGWHRHAAFAQRVTQDGLRIGANTPIPSHIGAGAGVDVTHAPSSDHFLVVWSDRRNEDDRGTDVIAQLINN